jgi:hypothetical protein
MERHDIISVRVSHLRIPKKYMEEERSLIRDNETCILDSHMTRNAGPMTPLLDFLSASKSKPNSIFHVGRLSGFLRKAVALFRSGQKSAVCHGATDTYNCTL